MYNNTAHFDASWDEKTHFTHVDFSRKIEIRTNIGDRDKLKKLSLEESLHL